MYTFPRPWYSGRPESLTSTSSPNPETSAARALWLAALPAAYAHAILRRAQRMLRRG